MKCKHEEECDECYDRMNPPTKEIERHAFVGCNYTRPCDDACHFLGGMVTAEPRCGKPESDQCHT